MKREEKRREIGGWVGSEFLSSPSQLSNLGHNGGEGFQIGVADEGSGDGSRRGGEEGGRERLIVIESGKVFILSSFAIPVGENKESRDLQLSWKWLRARINLFCGSLVAVSSVFSRGLARALTYEEALEQSMGATTSGNGSDFDFGGLVDGVVLKKPKPWGVESAKNAYAKLAEDGEAQLVDIRAAVEFREVGSPDIRGLKKQPVSIVHKGQDKLGFLKKLSFKFKEPENTTLFILDKFNGSSELVAELVTANGFKAACAIKDVLKIFNIKLLLQNSGLPWIPPKRSLGLDFGNLTEAISGALGIETILQLLGSAALVQFVGKKVLFAKDRKETLQQVDEFLNTKVATKELVDEIKQIRMALPSPSDKKALPAAPIEGSPNAVPNPILKDGAELF
ncbi:hypothetical protein NE237_027085 [Protea cynaroides]|uniref:Rhodanese domain-containing protein n=1 Tax=Protea cynaroides TaxID=273540 RepID=A0A9Q0JU32_9MAGN|nr:hypothetical protein NE237_027085 [Protea cynaroides]